MKIKFKNYDNIEFYTEDLNTYIPNEHFDFVFCTGLLYHLENPELFLENICTKTNKIYLNTCIHRFQQGINLIQENKTMIDQSITGTGCRPHYEWVLSQLRKYFNIVEILDAPNHKNFLFCGDNDRMVFYGK
jgi:hypothetical protein